LRERRRAERAVPALFVIYPMNALANSQQEELGKLARNAPGLVEFARYTGQESNEPASDRQVSARYPSHKFHDAGASSSPGRSRSTGRSSRIARPDFLVLDELHTYRGRQGADVAMLVRRLRERLTPSGVLQCIGPQRPWPARGRQKGAIARRRGRIASIRSRCSSGQRHH